MNKPGVCIQMCPKDTIDNRTTCKRKGYKRGEGKLQIALYKKPTIEKFSDISNILDFYNVEHYSNFGIIQPYESSFQHDSNYLFESFLNINNFINNLSKVENFNMDFIESKIENFTNDAFETNRKYNHEFNDDDISKGKIYENDGFFGLDYPRAEGSYITSDTKNFPVIKKQRSHKYTAYEDTANKNYIKKDQRAIDKNYIVAPRMGGFATFELGLKPNSDEFLKTSYVQDLPSYPEIPSYDIALYSPDESSNDYSRQEKVLKAKYKPSYEEKPYFSPLLNQIVKEMVNSFPLPQNEKPEMIKDIRELITKVKKNIRENDFKDRREYKEVLKQIYINGPVVTVVPNLSEG